MKKKNILCLVLTSFILNSCFSDKNDEIKKNDKAFYNALKTKNSDSCSIIKDEKLKINCQDNIIISNAIKDKNENKCDKVKNDENKNFCKDNIFFMKAIEKKDKTICLKIINKTKRQDCINNSK